MMKWAFLAPWREWCACNPASKGIIAAVIILVSLAYLPTLQYDYVTQDQWRAFRYSVEGEPPLVRGKQCGKMIAPFYLLTGRPFVWFGECVEHAMVSHISDFRYLRPIVFGVVLLTVLYLGSALSPLIGGFSMGGTAAAAFVVAPGYSFMYLQGMPAVMVLVSIILSALSFLLYSRESGHQGVPSTKVILASGTLFIAACLIYPAYAFIVVTLILIELGFGSSSLFMARVRLAVNKLLFYFGASLVYYALVKAILFLLKTYKGVLPDLGPYAVTIQKNPLVLYERLSELAQYFLHMPPFNFETPAGVTVFIFAAFVVVAARNAVARDNKETSVGFAMGALLLGVMSVILLLGSISPWLLSNMNSLETRQMVPWYLFFSASTVGLICFWLSFFPRVYKWAPLGILLLFVLPISIVQYRLSLLEVMVTNLEIESIRTHLSEWVRNKGWVDRKYLHVVLPISYRPTLVEQTINRTGYGSDNAVLASSKNPVSVPWMLHAVFREINDRPKINLVDCAFDRSCANDAMHNEGTIVLGYSKGFTEIRSPIEPFVINLSLLTSQPTMPLISGMNSPTVKASSTLESYGPFGLLTATQPGWHAERRPKYPQTLDIDLSEVKTFSKVRLLPQDGLRLRMPGRLEVSIRSENGDWLQVGHFDQLCGATTEDGWHEAVLDRSRSARFVRLVIPQNCGDPEFLTLKGLRFE